ncbi:MAG: GNAT family N-acetyltransferase [Alphaproteobacteria bacterium]
MLIRSMNINDLESVLNFSGQLGYANTIEGVNAKFSLIESDENHATFVAEDDAGKVVAFMHIFAFLSLHDEIHTKIKGLVVDESVRGQGFGEALIKQAIAWSDERGYRKISLESQTFRTESHAFYKKLGFHPEKEFFMFERKAHES